MLRHQSANAGGLGVLGVAATTATAGIIVGIALVLAAVALKYLRTRSARPSPAGA